VGAAVEELPYRPDSAALFTPLAARPWSVFLDSCPQGARGGRYDLIACEPRVRLLTRGALTEIQAADGVIRSPEDPFALVARSLGDGLDVPAELPFGGGAIGYLGYDLARRIERLPATARNPLRLPEMAIGVYDWVLLVDHAERSCLLVGDPRRSPQARDLLLRAARDALGARVGSFRLGGPWRSNMDEAGYAERFARVQRYIHAGDCYQINLARRFSVAGRGDPWPLYLQLRALSPAPFAAWLNTPDAWVLCASPERFLRVRGGTVETHPIKGTRPRGETPEDDRRLADELLASPKDRAENLMIVDLLRNDLGRVCATGSVQVPRLFALESYAGVHHLVSTVTGRLAPGATNLDLLRSCFPGGSITGAPKIRAMEIIEELEGERRGVYCGSIGYLGWDGRCDTNIVIRTLVHARGVLSLWAGGGLVADSECAAEAEEIAVKARGLRAAAERFRE
jgi:para-aminobenzoate synthetase component 1